MPRDREKVRRRLQEAALELFRTHGYEQVSGAAIACHAGVTERTFFRHFADKREVLFDREDELGATLANAVRAAEPTLSLWATMFAAFRETEPVLAANRSLAETRRSVIAASPALQERELAKAEALALKLASALEERGVATRAATLAAHIGMAAFSRAFSDWLDSGGSLVGHLETAFHDANELTALATSFEPEA